MECKCFYKEFVTVILIFWLKWGFFLSLKIGSEGGKKVKKCERKKLGGVVEPKERARDHDF